MDDEGCGRRLFSLPQKMSGTVRYGAVTPHSENANGANNTDRQAEASRDYPRYLILISRLFRACDGEKKL